MEFEPQRDGNRGVHLWKWKEERFVVLTSTLFLQQQSCCLIHGELETEGLPQPLVQSTVHGNSRSGSRSSALATLCLRLTRRLSFISRHDRENNWVGGVSDGVDRGSQFIQIRRRDLELPEQYSDTHLRSTTVTFQTLI